MNPFSASPTRRSLLRGAGLTLAAQFFSRRVGASATEVSPVMVALSSYMAEAGKRPLPEEITELLKQHILDTFAAMISGSELQPGVAALRFARASDTRGFSTIATSGIRCGAMEAALTNGMLAHADETDDSHSPSLSHPGCAVIPAALSVGEQLEIDGSRFLRAVALGYDIGPRVSLTLGGISFQTNTHRSSHAIAGIFGAAAAAGSCAGLDLQQMRWLLDYTAQQASGIAAWQSDTEHIEKAFVFGGMPARGGVTSALLVLSGWSGVDDVFSGPDNFLAAFAPGASPDGLIDQLSRRYEVKRTNIKKWSVGSPVQAPLDALEMLMRQHPFRFQQVQTITVHLAKQEALVVSDRALPDICLQHLLAVLLIDGTVSFLAAHDKTRMSDPETLRQRAKVKLVMDADLDALLPRRVAIVEVALANELRLSQRVENVRGTYENPMTWEEVSNKARDLIAPILGSDRFTKLLEKVRNFERCTNVREFGDLLQR